MNKITMNFFDYKNQVEVLFDPPRVPLSGKAGDNAIEGNEESLIRVTASAKINAPETVIQSVVDVYEHAIDEWEADAKQQAKRYAELDEKYRQMCLRDVINRTLTPEEDWHEDFGHSCLWVRIEDGDLVGEPPAITSPNSSDWLVRHPDQPDGWVTMEMWQASGDVLEQGQSLIDYYTHFYRLPEPIMPEPDQDEG